MILHTLGVYTQVNADWLFHLPFCLMVMCTLTQKNNTFLKINKVFCYTLPAFVFIYLAVHHRLGDFLLWKMSVGEWVLSLLLYFETRVSGFLMNKLTGVGKMSYAIYLLHIPVAMLIKKTVFIQDQTIGVTVKYVLWFTVTFALSYLLERVMQPAIKRFFFPKRALQSSLSST